MSRKPTKKEQYVLEIITHSANVAQFADFVGQVSKSIDLICGNAQTNTNVNGNSVSANIVTAYNACLAFFPNMFASTVRNHKKNRQYQKRFCRYAKYALLSSQASIGRANCVNCQIGLQAYLDENYQ